MSTSIWNKINIKLNGMVRYLKAFVRLDTKKVTHTQECLYPFLSFQLQDLTFIMM